MKDKLINKTISPVEDDMINIEKKNNFSKAVEELFRKEGLEKKTELSKSEVSKLAFLYDIANKYKFDDLKKILDKFLELRISVGRKGRKEIVDITKSLTELEKNEERLKEAIDKRL